MQQPDGMIAIAAKSEPRNWSDFGGAAEQQTMPFEPHRTVADRKLFDAASFQHHR
jgi:hypothetical protein